MAKYDYHGPMQMVSLRVGERQSEEGEPEPVFKDFTLVTGMTGITLPEKNALVESWLDAGLITETPADAGKPASKATAKGSEQ